MSDETWRDEAACRTADVSIFFTPRGQSQSEGRRQALATCAGCPVVDNCLQYALSIPWLVGTWGGTSAVERRRLRRHYSGPIDNTPPGPVRIRRVVRPPFKRSPEFERLRAVYDATHPRSGAA
jgi:WhiB family transcriptional regulator, redox-sensing transcriptional regulator